MAIGPYSGKETGETALLRTRLDAFSQGDLLVADRYFCSIFLIATLLGRGVQSCTRMHQKRTVDFRHGRRLGPYDHLVVWTKPQRPRWMDQATYDALPETLELRELRFDVTRPGYRTTQITIATTLTDPDVYTKDDIAELYGFRWNAELDIRAIKQNLNFSSSKFGKEISMIVRPSMRMTCVITDQTQGGGPCVQGRLAFCPVMSCNRGC